MKMYDPPAGHRYGFPRAYKPAYEGEPIEETLLRDGYPQHEVDNGGAMYVRVWDLISEGADNLDSLAWPELVDLMIKSIGGELTAYIAGLEDIRSLDVWIAGEKPLREVENRVRFAYQIVCTLREFNAYGVVEAWLTGNNPELGDQVPLRLLRDSDLESIGPRILGVASSFVVRG